MKSETKNSPTVFDHHGSIQKQPQKVMWYLKCTCFYLRIPFKSTNLAHSTRQINPNTGLEANVILKIFKLTLLNSPSGMLYFFTQHFQSVSCQPFLDSQISPLNQSKVEMISILKPRTNYKNSLVLRVSSKRVIQIGETRSTLKCNDLTAIKNSKQY